MIIERYWLPVHCDTIWPFSSCLDLPGSYTGWSPRGISFSYQHDHNLLGYHISNMLTCHNCIVEYFSSFISFWLLPGLCCSQWCWLDGFQQQEDREPVRIKEDHHSVSAFQIIQGAKEEHLIMAFFILDYTRTFSSLYLSLSLSLSLTLPSGSTL